MKNFYYLLLFVLIATVAVSCDDGDEKVDRFLEIAPADTNITLSDAAQSRAVEIKTDETNSANVQWLGDAWGRVEPTATGIVIYVDENVASSNRVATIHVALAQGEKQVEIKVTQEKQGSFLTSLPDEVRFNQLVGSKEILIATNQSDWQVEVPATDWLTVTTDYVKGRLLLDVIENTEDAERSIEIVLSSANAGLSKKVKVTQSEILTYILPYLGFGDPLPMARVFEEERGSTYYYGRNPMVMQTLSQVMPSMNYTPDEYEAYYLEFMEAWYYAPLFDESKYRALIAGVGYEFIFDEPTPWGPVKVSWREADKTAALIVQMDKGWGGNDGYVTFTKYAEKPNNPVQDKPMPTFSEFPFGFHTMDASFDDVKAWEAENGGHLIEDLPEGEIFNSIAFLTKTTPLVSRVYIKGGRANLTGVTDMVSIFNDMSLVWYGASLTNILTHEFKALLDSSGWVNFNPDSPDATYEFYHAVKGLRLKIYNMHFINLEGYENVPMVCFRLTPYTHSGFYAPMVTRPTTETAGQMLQRSRKAVSIESLI